MRHPDFPLTTAVPAPWQASLCLRFAARGGRTVLAGRQHRGPLMVQKPLYPEGGICHAIILHPPAGVAGGDTLDITLHAEAGTHAVIATPGATKWYKSLGRDASQHVRLTVDDGARLDWLPQENIVFDDARARIATELAVAPGGSAIGWDAVVLGRQASGEHWARGSVWLDTQVRCDGRALWIEQSQLDAASALRGAVPGLDGMCVLGTLWAVSSAATQELAETLAERLPLTADLRAGVTCLSSPAQSMLLLRVLGRQMEPVRQLMVDAWSALREPIHGVPARPLRLWAT